MTKKLVEVRPAEEAKGTVAVFLSSLCPCAKSHEPVLTELANRFKDYKFIGIVSGQDVENEVTEHYAKAQLPFPVILDPKSQLANRYGALKTPHVFIIHREGKCLYRGGIDNSKEAPRATEPYLKMALEDLNANRELRFKETRALGCVIRR